MGNAVVRAVVMMAWGVVFGWGLHTMVPYCMREERELHKDILEIVAAVATLVILVACTISDAPRLNLATPVSQAARERQQNRQSFAELWTRSSTVEAEMTKIARLLDNTRSDLGGLTQEYKTLGTQVSTTASKVQQIETTVRKTNERLAEFGEPGMMQKLAKERDDAVAQSKQSDDEVRQLTLKLQRAGAYP